MWNSYKFSEMAYLQKDTYLPSPSEKLPYIGLEHIDEQSLSLNSIGTSNDITSNKFLFESNDVLFGKLRPYFRKVYKPQFKGICSTDIWVLRTHKGFSQEFLFYFLANPVFIKKVTNASIGTHMPRADWSFLSNTRWLIPLFEEQEEIASILSSLDQKIDFLRRQNKTLEQIAQTLFKHWFLNFEFPDENGQPYKSSDGEMVSSELGEIPEGWRVGKINEISTISTGKGLKRTEYIEKGLYPVYGANGEMGRTNSFLFDEKLIITGRVGTLGNIYIVKSKMWISDNVLILKPEENFFYFTYFAMKRINFQSLNRGSTQPLITQTDLKYFEIITPEEKLVENFDLFSLGLFSKIENNMGQINRLTKIRDILLPKLMSGQIRVN